MYLLDSNILIDLRDGIPAIEDRVSALPAVPKLSLLSWVELEGGIDMAQAIGFDRRRTTDALLRVFEVLPCDPAVVRAYAAILASTGYSRRKVLDRLIAATAIVHDLTLVTMNPADFADIPDLRLEVWPAQ